MEEGREDKSLTCGPRLAARPSGEGRLRACSRLGSAQDGDVGLGRGEKDGAGLLQIGPGKEGAGLRWSEGADRLGSSDWKREEGGVFFYSFFSSFLICFKALFKWI